MRSKSYMGFGIILLAACSMGAKDPDAQHATAQIRDASGLQLGLAKFQQTANGVRMEWKLSFLKPGAAALHIHEKGICQGPDFKSAGPHFNPANKEHGKDSSNGPHLGDLPNLVANERGEATGVFEINGATLGDDGKSIRGRALIIHSGKDDYRSQPSGNAGPPMACGVIR